MSGCCWLRFAEMRPFPSLKNQKAERFRSPAVGITPAIYIVTSTLSRAARRDLRRCNCPPGNGCLPGNQGMNVLLGDEKSEPANKIKIRRLPRARRLCALVSGRHLQGDLAEAPKSSGCMVIKPHATPSGKLQAELDTASRPRAPRMPTSRCSSESFLKREAEHVEGFSRNSLSLPSRRRALTERYVIRPTSERSLPFLC